MLYKTQHFPKDLKDDKLMYIPNDDTQNYRSYRLQLVVFFVKTSYINEQEHI